MTSFGELKLPKDRQLLKVAQRVYELLQEISKIEADTQMSVNEKLSCIKNIKNELNKVAAEIDTIKQEFNLLTNYRIN